MQLAVVAAGFTPGEADRLRRAMAAWRRRGGLEPFEKRLKDGMRERGYPEQFAEQIFRQILGFGEYGFPESHSASFALLVYVSCWLKCYEPAAFTCALLNSQPMGFYAPSQLVQDAQRHGVEVRPVDVLVSEWDCTLERVHWPTQSEARGSRPMGTRAGEAPEVRKARGTRHEARRNTRRATCPPSGIAYGERLSEGECHAPGGGAHRGWERAPPPPLRGRAGVGVQRSHRATARIQPPSLPSP